jgi:GNAT superfamily N-acetyltransferase
MSRSYEISTDRRRLNIELIHGFLRESYWAANIPMAVVKRSIKHSLCFGAYWKGQQVAFARVITDRATFAYLADVFVVPEQRGHGLGKKLVQTILAHPELQVLRRVLLATRDAHGLYSQFGFKPLAEPAHFMTLHFPDVYVMKKTRGRIRPGDARQNSSESPPGA